LWWVYNPIEGSPSWENAILINTGVLEYWGFGVMIEEFGVLFFQHSNTPSLQYSTAEDFMNSWQPENYLIY
jgi:hypothetical protein